MMRQLPIRLRLTLWYSVMFATAALLLSCTSWWMLRRAIDATTRQDLQERIDDIHMQLQQFGPQLSPTETQMRFDAIYRYRDDGKWLQIQDQDGHWIYRSSRMVSLGNSLPLLRATKGNIVEFTQGTRHVYALISLVCISGQNYTVETGASINKQQAWLQHFGLGLLLLTPAVLITAILAGHVMSRKALTPVALIANEARRISDKNLNQRLPISAANDELSDLSVTLNSMLARIDAGFRSVRDFTANASHELRTPLARLRTEIEITLLRPRSADEYSDALQRLQETTIDMTALIDGLLRLARAEAGSDSLHLSAVDLESVIQKTLGEWDPVTTHLGIDLRREGDESAGSGSLIVLGDAISLQRLLSIWLDNACKFTQRGGRIAVIAESQGDTVVLALQDTGIGIPLDQHERIFERFYRIQGDKGKPQGGSGLGLSLAAWIAAEHNTEIHLDSCPGKGSRFQIALAHVHTGFSSPAAVQHNTSLLTSRTDPHPASLDSTRTPSSRSIC
jgi:heavy metal sensor kinase